MAAVVPAGKDHFRRCWIEKPVYAGGNVTTLVLPDLDSKNNGLSGEECFVTACGAEVNVSTMQGKTLATHVSPLPDDVVLHVAASSYFSKAPNAAENRSENEGVFVAYSTRDLQVTVLQLEAYVELPEEDEEEEDEQADDGEERQAKEPSTDLLAGLERKYRFKQVQSWTAGQHAVGCIKFVNNGAHLISGSTDGAVKVWDVFHHHLTHNLKCSAGNVTSAMELSAPAWDEKGRQLLAVGNVEGHITVFDWDSKKLVGTARPHTTTISAINFDTNSKHIFTAGCDRKFSVVAVEDTKEQQKGGVYETLAIKRTVAVKDHVSCALFESSTVLHLGTLDGIVASYYVHKSDPVQVIRRSKKPKGIDIDNADEELAIRCLALPITKGCCIEDDAAVPQSPVRRRKSKAADFPKPDSTILFAGDAAYNVTVFTHTDDPVTLKQRWEEKTSLVGFMDQVLDVKMINNDKARPVGMMEMDETAPKLSRLIVTNSKDVRVYPERGCVSSVMLRGHDGIVLVAAVSADHKIVATGSKDHTVRFWSTATWTEIARGTKDTSNAAHTDDVNCVGFTNRLDSGLSLCASGAIDENVRIWDMAPLHKVVEELEKQLIEMSAQENAVEGDAIQFPEVLELTPITGVSQAHAGAVHCVSFSPNDAFLATGGRDKVVNVFNVKGKKLFKEASMRGHKRGINSVAFSPLDRIVASASNDGTIRLWSLLSFSCIKVLQVDKQAVLQAQFFNKGTQMVSTTMEGIVRIWAVSSGEVVTNVETHEDKVWALDVMETTVEDANACAGGEVETHFFTGGADGTTALVEDYTAENTRRIRKEREEDVEQRQELANAVRNGEYKKAFMVALRLNHPRHLRQVINTWLAKDVGGCEEGVVDLVQELGNDNFHRLLEFTREWLTNARHSTVAAVVIQGVLRGYHFMDLVEMPAIQHILEALWSYSKRHSNRVQLLLNQLHYCDYLCRSLDPNLLVANTGNKETDAEAEEGDDKKKRKRNGAEGAQEDSMPTKAKKKSEQQHANGAASSKTAAGKTPKRK